MENQATAVELMDCAVILPVAQLYEPEMSSEEAYEVTRGYWRISPARHRCLQYAVAAYEGRVLEVYRIEGWERAPAEHPNKWAFTGRVAEHAIRSEYVGGSLANYRDRLAYGGRVYTSCSC